MAILNITLPEGASICNGKQVTFRAPCDSTGVTGIKIGDVTYALLNTAGEGIDKGASFVAGTLVSVLIDTEQNKAFLQSSPGGVDIIELTYAEYQALETKNPDVMYLVTDKSVIPGGEDYVLNTQLGVSVATLVDGKVPTAQLPAMDYAPSTHAIQHASGGADPITPVSIGAAPAYTYGTTDLTAGSSPLETGKLYFVYE